MLVLRVFLSLFIFSYVVPAAGATSPLDTKHKEYIGLVYTRSTILFISFLYVDIRLMDKILHYPL